ncbi:MAG: alkaline phosphatase family protein [Candidatus Baltobacteraceae bacterium]
MVFIVQENRSFNNIFMGYPKALTQNYGYDQSGNKIPLHQQDLVTLWDIDHSANGFFAAYDNGKIDGWNNEYTCCGSIPPNFAYAYVTRSEIQPYWAMARQYVLADHAFQSNLDGSFIAHQYAIAAYASHAVNFPGNSWGCPGGPNDTVPTLNPDRSYGPYITACFNNPTIGSELDAKGLSWRFYTTDINNWDGGLWNAYQAISNIYLQPDWYNNVVTPQSQFLSDIGSGKLANVTWITPTFENSDHAGLDQLTGPPWVASLVNAVGQSQFWDSSAIFVIWDDWGGWFDPVVPVYEDYDGLGFRIPMLMISPYAKRGVVAHKQYESSSVLKFMEDTFGLAPLATSDGRALDPAAEAFNFRQPPRPFQPFAGARPLQYWRTQPHPNAGRRPLNGD